MEETKKKALLPSEEILRQVVKKQAEINEERIGVLYRLRSLASISFASALKEKFTVKRAKLNKIF